MLMKTALKNLRKNPVMNLICLIQLTAVFLIAAVMVSAMSVRYQTYEPLKYILDKRGISSYYSISWFGALTPGGDPNVDAVFSVDELCGYMNADRAVTIREQIMLLPDQSELAVTLFYDNDMIHRWNPGIKRGRWLSADANELEIVITDGAFGLDAGDETELIIGQYHQQGIPVKVKVVGVLDDDAKILGETSNRLKSGDTYSYLYRPLNDLSNSYFIASDDVIRELYPSAFKLYTISAFYFYDDVSDEFLSDAMKTAASMNAGVSLSLEEINKNSKEYLRAELMKLLPIVIILLILTTVSSISTSALSARRRLKDYAKYYMLGLQWRQCALVNLLQSLIIGATALLIASAGLAVIGVMSLSETFMIIWNVPMLLTLPVILTIYLAFSMIMPILMLRSTTPKTLLQTE